MEIHVGAGIMIRATTEYLNGANYGWLLRL